eukprot:Hpha_TRINITY_DN16727_c0_g3::TRINITY_DN16727_c0_g3_i1::g.79313::m.79313
MGENAEDLDMGGIAEVKTPDAKWVEPFKYEPWLEWGGQIEEKGTDCGGSIFNRGRVKVGESVRVRNGEKGFYPYLVWIRKGYDRREWGGKVKGIFRGPRGKSGSSKWEDQVREMGSGGQQH